MVHTVLSHWRVKDTDDNKNPGCVDCEWVIYKSCGGMSRWKSCGVLVINWLFCEFENQPALRTSHMSALLGEKGYFLFFFFTNLN